MRGLFDAQQMPVFEKRFDQRRRGFDPVFEDCALLDQVDNGKKEQRFVRRGLSKISIDAQARDSVEIKSRNIRLLHKFNQQFADLTVNIF